MPAVPARECGGEAGEPVCEERGVKGVASFQFYILSKANKDISDREARRKEVEEFRKRKKITQRRRVHRGSQRRGERSERERGAKDRGIVPRSLRYGPQTARASGRDDTLGSSLGRAENRREEGVRR